MAGSGQTEDGSFPVRDFAVEASKPWPVRPSPLADESMTSWLIRLSETNGVTVKTAFNCIMSGVRTGFDPDQRPPEGFIAGLETVSRVPHEQLNALTLIPFLAALQPYKTKAGSNQMPWKCRDLGAPRLVKNQFCPLCLAADPIPYFRLSWRLSFVTVCDRHRIPLWDFCPFCIDHIDLLAEFKGVPKGCGPLIPFCRTCGSDLRGAQPNRISPGESETGDLVKSALQHQRTLLSVMKTGHLSRTKGKDIEASKLFTSFRHLIRDLKSPRFADGFLDVLQSEWPSATSLPAMFTQDRKEFDQMSTLARLVILGVSDWDAHGMDIDFFQKKGSLGKVPLMASRYWKLRFDPSFSIDPKPYCLIELNKK